MSRLQHIGEGIINLIPYLTLMSTSSYSRRRDDPDTTWFSKMGKQIAVSLITAIAISFISGIASAYVSLRLFAQEITQTKLDIVRVEHDSKEGRIFLQAQIDMQRDRIDRVVDRRMVDHQ